MNNSGNMVITSLSNCTIQIKPHIICGVCMHGAVVISSYCNNLNSEVNETLTFANSHSIYTRTDQTLT